MTSPGKVSLPIVMKSVVKIFAQTCSPNFSLPWQMKRQTSSTSSGFIISGKRIICNAHGVAFQKTVRVRKHGDSTKFVAKVLYVGHECDLAMLTVEDDRFWQGLTALELSSVPDLQDEVVVVGYPTGGDNISITKGIISRIAVTNYSHAHGRLLSIQIDAAINAGNSGGPALRNGKVVGVAFETLNDAENIGYIIPTPVIRHFLNDIENNKSYNGFCSGGFYWQKIENKTMRAALKLDTYAPTSSSASAVSDKENTSVNADGEVDLVGIGETTTEIGILINKVLPLCKSAEVVQKGDVLMEIDGVKIASDGTIVFRGDERVGFDYLFNRKYVADSVSFTIMRDGKQLTVNTTLESTTPLVPNHMYDKKPSFFIYGGFVFTALTYPLLRSEYGDKWDKKAPIRLCEKAFYGYQSRKNEQVVVLSQCLVGEYNIGYDDVTNVQVKKVDGVEITSLQHLYDILINKKDGVCDNGNVQADTDTTMTGATETVKVTMNGAGKKRSAPIGGEKSHDNNNINKKAKIQNDDSNHSHSNSNSNGCINRDSDSDSNSNSNSNDKKSAQGSSNSRTDERNEIVHIIELDHHSTVIVKHSQAMLDNKYVCLQNHISKSCSDDMK